MTRYHLKFSASDFPPEVVDATNLLFEAKPWSLDSGQLDLFQRWSDVVCDAYGIPAVGIHKIPGDSIGFEYMVGPVPNIVICRYSLATLFVAVGAHLILSCEQGTADTRNGANMEWGYSLFYAVKPVMFRRRVREGRIQGLTARDTFSNDTWDRLVTMGLTNGNFLVDPHFDIRTLDADDDLVNPDEVEESDADTEDVAPVTPIIRNDDQDFHNGLSALPVTTLRKISRGIIQGGYNMPKNTLVDNLFNADRESVRNALVAVVTGI